VTAQSAVRGYSCGWLACRGGGFRAGAGRPRRPIPEWRAGSGVDVFFRAEWIPESPPLLLDEPGAAAVRIEPGEFRGFVGPPGFCCGAGSLMVLTGGQSGVQPLSRPKRSVGLPTMPRRHIPLVGELDVRRGQDGYLSQERPPVAAAASPWSLRGGGAVTTASGRLCACRGGVVLAARARSAVTNGPPSAPPLTVFVPGPRWERWALPAALPPSCSPSAATRDPGLTSAPIPGPPGAGWWAPAASAGC